MQNKTMTGKTVLITGANSGIGLATAEGLASAGARVIMVARSQEKGEAARRQVVQTSGNRDVHLLLADLSSQADIHRLAEDVLEGFDRLDVLINNAAIVPDKRMVTVDGFEWQFAVNHLSYFLLTHLLLDRIIASQPSRIINLTSNLHARGHVDFDDLQASRSYGQMGFGQYANTKLMNMLFTYELARRLSGTQVTVNCVHPGMIGTNLSRTMPKLMHRIYLAMLPKPADGAKTSIYAATAPELANVTGKYLVDSRVTESSPASHDVDVQKRLWDVSKQMTGIKAMAFA